MSCYDGGEERLALVAELRGGAKMAQAERLLAANNPNNAVQPHTMFGTGAPAVAGAFSAAPAMPPPPQFAAMGVPPPPPGAFGAMIRVELSTFTPFLM